MLDITFFTSNPTKLAHARYLAEGLPVRIKGFRQRTYHADYFEPRVQSRDELLLASYESAVGQSKKAGILNKRHFFILEDTSVRIEALSDNSKEVPGLDVKYWMRQATFADLNASIERAGGNRRATVRSDVVLHIPEAYRQAWNLPERYMVFVGEQDGTIVSTEADFETNLVFPWLDNKTFNRWFVPNGAQEPLGKLPIREATKYDFRAKSFKKLFDFLKSKKLLNEFLRQGDLPLRPEINFIICGYTCAGKTAASQFLAREFDYLHVEASDFMYLNYYIRHDFQNAISIGDFAERALSEKPEIAAEKIAEYLIDEPMTAAVISGFRSQEEIDWITYKLRPYGRRFEVISVEAAEDIRFERMKRRRREGDGDSLEKFRRRDEQQRRMGLNEIAGSDRAKIWTNNSSLTDYLDLVKRAIAQRADSHSPTDEQIRQLNSTQSIRLEEAILIALLSNWTDDENRKFFTTSEIAKVAKSLFPSAQKHKDNVSRYFNQYFYVYYEIQEDERRVRRYRLSNTGYGKAITVLRRLVASHRHEQS
ncbi:non-canonical purine NTP pyrophosphatase [Rhizobium leguminosarum]|uniref:non-canonical purine NTP pyrophosphatase n=1 Tax=Rhizobium TaxID=379 RepID=UPI00140FA199|nr:non-canonical purine NTP pyrophosphatase [Rhizobium leguminosarum]QIO69331.1 AAA family ATPase [Rhizobium leguminosarum bv. trifolii]